MKDRSKTKKQLIAELTALRREMGAMRQRVATLEAVTREPRHSNMAAECQKEPPDHPPEVRRFAPTTSGLDQLFQQTHQVLRKTLSYDVCSLHWLDEKDGVLRLSGNTTNGQSRGLPTGETIPLGHGIAEQVAMAGQGQIANYIQNEAHDVDSAQQHVTLRHLISVPVHVEETLAGVFNVGRLNDPPFSVEEFELATIFISQAAFAFPNLQRYAELKHHAVELSTILEAATVASSTLNLEEVLVHIAERNQAEDALRESEDRYRRLVELSPELIAVHCQGTIVYINRAGVDLLGAGSPDEIIGRSVLDFVHPQYRDVVKNRVRQIELEKKQPGLLEEKLLKLDGQIIDVEVTGIPFVYEGQAATQVMVRDVTRRKKLEEQLRQSQKMEAIGQLAGGIAHDFNNLLTTIMGYSGFALERVAADDPVRSDIQGIQKSARVAANLTRQLLAFARRQIIEPEVLALNELMVNMDSMLRQLIRSDIELVTLPDPDSGLVKVDPGQVEQILVNLALNACDAMPDGGKLTIETVNVRLNRNYASQQSEVLPGEYVMLAVTDNGTGMTEEIKARIFEPFFTTKEVGKGTGLGLATCFGIVKQNKGHIWVYSEVGHGTSFKIYLPRVNETGRKLTLSASAGDLPRGTELILLVEDEKDVRDLSTRILRHRGYRVMAASNGQEALRLARTKLGSKIDLLITDVIIPKVGGKSLADQLKVLYADLKILYISGYTDRAIVHHGVLDPGLEFLQKPFLPEDLARSVRQTLDA